MAAESPIYKIQRYAVHDGPGIRTTLFFQGCPLSCRWCHNPESQGMPTGTAGHDPAPVIREIKKDLIFYDQSGGGVTFSGGEPLCHPDLLFRLLDTCRKTGIHTCLDTCGHASWDILSAAAARSDLIHFDVKIAGKADHIAFTGRSPERIMDNLTRLSRTGARVRLRFPLIPGITDTPENIDGLITFLTARTRYRDIDILPYHDTAKGKYQKLNRPYALDHIRPPDTTAVDAVTHRFDTHGFTVTIGG